MIATIGDLSEVYARTVGGQSTLGLPRGLNAALWIKGGLLHPLPVR